MTCISQQDYTSRVVNPFIQRLPIHQAPFESQPDKPEQPADPARRYPVSSRKCELPSHRGSKSPKSCLILSALPSAVQDSTDPSSGCASARLYSSFRYTECSCGQRIRAGTSRERRWTHDKIPHQVPLRPHPCSHLWAFDEPT